MRTVILGLALALVGCQASPDRSPCADFDCSGHGTCQSVASPKGPVATCVCRTGYLPSASGWLCLPAKEASLCSGITCSGRGTCAVVQGRARCVCQPNTLLGEDGLSCADPCAAVSCSGSGSCVLEGSAARCQCKTGFLASADGLSCSAPRPENVVTYGLTYDQYPTYPFGHQYLDMSEQAAGKLVEVLSYDWHFGSGGGLSRRTRTTYTLDKSGLVITGVEYVEDYALGKVNRRRGGKATLGPTGGTLTFQRKDQLATVPLAWSGGAPLPGLGGWEYPGWAFGSFSPVFYTMALKRYDAQKKGPQDLDVIWLEAGVQSRLKVAADPSWTDAKPVLLFTDYNIKVTYKDDLPLAIHLVDEELTWSRYSGTPVDLNLGPAVPATPFTPAPLPVDLVESTVSFTASDGTALAGTLARPTSKPGNAPAVLLVSDMLGWDRDNPFLRLPATPLYRHLAAHLAHAGYATLRWDPRGRGLSKGATTEYTLAKLRADATAAFDHLAAAAGVDKTRIYVLALGPGSLVAAGILDKTPRGVLLLSPIVKDTDKVLVYNGIAHLKAAGFGGNFINSQTKAITDELAKLKDGTYTGTDYRGLPVPLWKEMLAFDGTAALLGYTGPVQALQGDQDLEVPPEQLTAILDAATKAGKKNLTTKTLAGVSYTLAEAKAAELLETVVLPLSLPAASLDAILGWLTLNP